jgi:hypothetical protein
MQEAFLWVLNLSLMAITAHWTADRSGLPFSVVRAAADRLAHHGLIKENSSRVDVEIMKHDK